ncbi:YdhK family protein [Yaniella halotolerans]|uniref:YdhK family protein n=1 Tax=Yaniella halotolerans TaxID=225453 RepID=UPI0003B48D63|nr:YdhK family protein [Yaniella halotolerans]
MKTVTRMTRLTLSAAAGVLFLTACGGTGDEETEPQPEPTETATETDDANQDAGAHDHNPDGGPPPEGIQEATDPTYEVGQNVILEADHMPGMEGTEATISGAFDTITYSVSYTPTDGGDPVEDHKWVVHEELEDPGDAPLDPGSTATLNATHMAGMEGAEATIDSSTDETVYMVDFEMDGMEMTNHKWVVESEVQPVD